MAQSWYIYASVLISYLKIWRDFVLCVIYMCNSRYNHWLHMSRMWLWLFDSSFSLIAHSGSSSNAKYDPDQIKAEIACRRERVSHYPLRTMPHTSGPRGDAGPLMCRVDCVFLYVYW